MTADPPGPSKKDFDARLHAAQAKQAERKGETAPGSRGSGHWLASRSGTELGAGVALGVAIGLGLDYWLDSRPWFMILFFFLCAGAGMLNVYRTVSGIVHAVGYEKLARPPKPGGGSAEDRK